MKKQFKSKEELDKYLESFEEVRDMFTLYFDEEKAIESLLADGYDLDDLTEDGHGYEFCGHKNNGWLYRDEVMFPEESNVEIRERK